MYVSRLRLENWRNFVDVDVELRERTFLVGPNASGKSNLLDVFRFLRDVAGPGGGLQKAILDRGGLSKVRCLLARRNPRVRISVDLTDEKSDSVWTYDLAILQETRGNRNVLVDHEIVTHNGSVILSRPGRDDQSDSLRLSQSHLEQINANARFREIAQFFEKVTYLHLVPQLIKHSDAFTGPGLLGDPFGKNLLEQIARVPEKSRARRLKKIEMALKSVVPLLERLVLERDAYSGTPHLAAFYRHLPFNAGTQREDQMSDGTLRLIGLFWSLLSGASLLLLEEPELSLNAAVVERLAPLLARMQGRRRRQVLVSSHSVDLLSDPGIEPESVLILTPSNQGTTVQPASSLDGVRESLAAGLSLNDVIQPKVREMVPLAAQQLSLSFDE
jgi:predicted ATPase